LPGDGLTPHGELVVLKMFTNTHSPALVAVFTWMEKYEMTWVSFAHAAGPNCIDPS